MLFSKSHTDAEIAQAAISITKGEKGIFLVAVDSGAAGQDDLHVIHAEDQFAAELASMQAFADYFDVSLEEFTQWTEDSARNQWSFRVLSVEEIQSWGDDDDDYQNSDSPIAYLGMRIK